ncbi:hypothetical protein GTGU_02689 [Trabulsiella guamensis ATCC 49490]|uniref:Uncharacterized protein n=1 Tax=Trabulsiella guamensis ATCC 49490 TaxID=1005994 RepID=A0A085A7H3_9ENTR|nr:hypothetical protein GTGU_02689 [Trabulsiella guamensis ATCC 49490]
MAGVCEARESNAKGDVLFYEALSAISTVLHSVAGKVEAAFSG